MNSNEIIKAIKNITNSIPKIIWTLSCYIIALALAFISGYFTVKFYIDDQISPITNFQKLKVIFSVLPEKLIDKVYSKIVKFF